MYGSSLRHLMPLLSLASVLVGCSMDKYEFISSIDKPMSIALVDHHRDKTLWEIDIPVDHKLVLDFDRPFEFEPIRANMEAATKMSWRLYNLRPALGRNLPIKWQTKDLPGTPFMIKMSLRPAPEFPPDDRPIATSQPPATMQTLPADAPPDDVPLAEDVPVEDQEENQ